MPDGEELEAGLAGWDPAPVAAEDPMDPGPSVALAAVLDQSPPVGMLPPLWHWLHFLHWAPTGALGGDGHPSSGDFLPPIPERTRMFVGGRLEVRTGLRTGVPAVRRSAVTSRTVKQGRTGAMLFVTVRHEIEQGGSVAVVDEQDLMYRSGAPSRPAPEVRVGGPLSADAPWQRPFVAGPVLLFRFSALTANSHRIHYDQPYATGVEGYPGLVVHGPLLAILMAGLVAHHAPGRTLASLRYRFARPVFAGDSTLLTGRPDDDKAELAVIAADGEPSALASVVFT